MQYLPILKAKQGELRALREWNEIARPNVHPLVEVVPWDREDDVTGSARREADLREVDRVVDRIAKAWEGKSQSIFVDAAYAEPDLVEEQESWTTIEPTLSPILRGLYSRGIAAAPVVRASVDSAYAKSIGTTLRLGGRPSAVIRVTAEDLDDTVAPLRQMVLRTAAALLLKHAEVSVVLDLGAVADEGAMLLASRLARFVLPQLAEDGWRSLTVASGAFPINLAAVQAFEVGMVPRWDYRLWQGLQSFELPNATQLGFSDYAVTHPVMPIGAAFAAPPQLRYTVEGAWAVAKGKRQDRRGHTQFFDVCELVLDYLGPQASRPEAGWGDDYIHRAAAMVGPFPPQAPPGTGNAATWRAIATSHHLAYTADQLAAVDAT